MKKTEKEWLEVSQKGLFPNFTENSRSFKRVQDSKNGQDVDVELLRKIRTEIHICSWKK